MHQWTPVNTHGQAPTPRRAHSATLVDALVYVFGGGEGATFYNELYVLDLRNRTWYRPRVQGTPPSPRRAHSCTRHNGYLYVFGGGSEHGTFNDLHRLDVRNPEQVSWRRLLCTGAVPTTRGYHTATLVHNKLLVLGGSNGRRALDDLYVLEIDTLMWRRPPQPHLRIHLLAHSATLVGPMLFVFGGHNDIGYTNALLRLDLCTLQWRTSVVEGKAPVGRGSHLAWLHDSRLYIHGGFQGRRALSELHVLELASCAYLPVLAPPTLLSVA